MKLPKGWLMLQKGDMIELQNGHIIIQVYHTPPSNIRIIDKRNPFFSRIREELENMFAEVDSAGNEINEIFEEVKNLARSKSKKN